MSNRAVQQRLKAKDNQDLIDLEESLGKSDSDDDEPVSTSSSSLNAFSLLAGEEEGVPEDEEEDDKEKPTTKEQKKAQPKPAPKSNRKKRKKGRGKRKPKDEDIDAIVRELDLEDQKGKGKEKEKEKENKAPIKQQDEDKLFNLSAEFLSSDAELKRLFGAKTIASQRQENPAGIGKRGGAVRKRMVLVAHKPSWPPVEGGITMELTETRQGVSYFNMAWSEQYKKLQQQYFMCVETMDPDSIAELLQFHPYHLDSLLQLADVCKQSSEHETAIDLVERAVLRFEDCWHPLFYQAILKGVGRLEYSNEQNRPFHLALFRYIHMLGRRGCVRTALEYCKLLLSMDPSDPLGILLVFDHFCIRAKEYEYLLRFVREANNWHEKVIQREGEKDKEPTPSLPPLIDLPNFAFSVALAKYSLEIEKKEVSEETLSSGSLLQDALLAYPMVLVPLAEKCGVRMSLKEPGCPATWEEVCRHRYFSGPYDSNVKHVVPVFVTLNFPFWKTNEIALWIKINAWETLKRVDKKDPALLQMANKKFDAYFSRPNVYNHVLLSDLVDAISQLPGHARIFRLYDQIGPDKDRVPALTANPLALFLSTLMPWTQVPNAPPDAAGGAGPAGQQPQQGTEWLLANLLPLLGRPQGTGQPRDDDDEGEDD